MNLKRIFKIFISIILLSVFILELQRQWTNQPYFVISITPDQQEEHDTINIEKYLHNWTTFAYFTTWSNLFFVTIFALSAIFNIKIKQNIKLIFTTYLIIISIFFWTALFWFYPWGQSGYFDFINIYEHSFCLIVSLIWIFKSNSKEKVVRSLKGLLIFPIIYVIGTIIINSYSGGKVSVYPFLNILNWYNLGLNMWLSILLSILSLTVISLFFIISYLVLIKLINIKNKK